MTDRFSPMPLVLAHWKCLSVDVDGSKTKPDWLARSVLLILSAGAGTATILLGGTLANAGALLAADALLASSLLAVFAQITSLRMKFSDRYESGLPDSDTDKDAMDESATHLLFAAMLAFVNAAVLAAGVAFAPPSELRLAGPLAAVSASLFVYQALLLVMLLPRLLHAYTTVNGVRKELSGFYRK